MCRRRFVPGTRRRLGPLVGLGTRRRPHQLPAATPAAIPPGGHLVGTGAPLVVPVQPTVAGDLTAPGSVTGPSTGQSLGAPVPTTTTSTTSTATTGARTTTSVPPTTAPVPVQGEGLLRLALEAPPPRGDRPAELDRGRRHLTDLTTHQVGDTQQFVLFWGASPFVYAGFAGPVRTSDRYS